MKKKRSIKKSILTIVSLLLIAVIVIHNDGLFNDNTTYAAGDLSINWNVPTGDPIFVVENMLPGDTEDRDVVIENTGPSPREVGIKGVKTDEIASFAGILDFVIAADGVPIYGTGSPTNAKTLQEFFDESSGMNGHSLGILNSGDTSTYNFKATFPPESGNEYQGARVVFDLIIGVIADEIPAECNLINFTGPTIYGTSDSEYIQGTGKSEMIITFEGNDKVEAGGGHDCIITGEGKDYVDDQTGNDVTDLGPGDDIQSPSGGKDVIYGGTGKDKIDAGSSDDKVYAGEGDDWVDGGSGKDLIQGGSGNDTLTGGSGNDEVFGESGDDSLFGGSGKDFLDGGADEDSANGQTGTDTCIAETETNCEL